MSIQPSAEFDPATTLDLWTLVPTIPAADDRAAWAHDAAQEAAELRGLEPAYVERIATLLDALAEDAPPEPASWRLLFFLQPEHGATVWDLAFLDPDATTTERSLVGADEPAQLGNDVSEFEFNGLGGLQCVRFDLVEGAGDTTPGEQAIEATAAITVSRSLAGRPTALLAATRTIHLESMATSLVAMQYLLTTELLEQLATQDPQTDPSGTT